MIKAGRPPFVGVWPNVRTASEFPGKPNPWKRYYVFESWRGRKTADDFIVKPLKSIAPARLSKSGDDIFQIHVCDEFPEFLTCEMPPRDLNGFEVERSRLEI